jgi:hypothetical protein
MDRMDGGERERTRSWGEVVRRWAKRARKGRDAPAEESAAGQHESVVTLTCVVERTQALVRQLEVELQSERALMSAKLERLAHENRLLRDRLGERQGSAGALGASAAPPGPGRVSPFRRGQRGN